MVEWELAQSLVQTLKNAEKTGANRERSRIIKLLEEECDCVLVPSTYYAGCHNHQLIALIKGE